MSIFSDDNKVSGAWMKFTKIGDCIEGTLVNKRETTSQLTGLPQTIYEIKATGNVIINGEKRPVAPGEIWLVGGKAVIDNQMRHVRLGQIIGMRFESEKPNPDKFKNAAKIIQVFANTNIVDESWVAEEDSEASDGDSYARRNSEKEDKFNEELDSANAEMIRKEINSIAKKKLGAENDEDIKIKVMEATKLAFIDQNLDAILAELKKL